VKGKVIGYWMATALISLETFVGGLTDLVHGGTMLVSGPRVVDVVTQLGYPAYVLTILGVWKLLGAITLLVPGFARLKEWAYAGIFFELTGAAASHAARGNWNLLLAPLILTAITLASWILRAANRTLARVGCWKWSVRIANYVHNDAPCVHI
jgi:hypothetical protein